MHLHQPPLALVAGACRSCTVWIAPRRCRHVTAGTRVAREFSDVPFRMHTVRGPERPQQISPGQSALGFRGIALGVLPGDRPGLSEAAPPGSEAPPWVPEAPPWESASASGTASRLTNNPRRRGGG
jgi:hypothetical protein